MGQELREDLDALRGIGAQLNAASAEAALVVQAVEHFLCEELCIGLTAASRPFDSQRVLGDDNQELIVTSHLAFGRVQGKDRIYVLKATLEKNEWQENFTKIVAEDRTPWPSCPREVRLASFVMLPELLGNLAARVEEVSNQTTRTVAMVRDLMEIMKQPPPNRDSVEVEIGVGAGADSDESEPGDVPPLQELTVSSAPNLFKRPRAKV